MTAEVRGRLSNDITRCEDDACPDRHICARWIQREGVQWRQPTFRAPDAVHCGSLILEQSEYHRVPSMLEQAQEDGLESCF